MAKSSSLLKWVTEQETSEGQKIIKEIQKLSFAKGLTVDVRSEWESKDSDRKEIKNPSLLISLRLMRSSDDSYYSSRDAAVVIKKIKAERTQTLNKVQDDLQKQIADLEDQISAQSKRLEKIGGLLANMDREERRAKAMLVASKLQSMDGGSEMIEALSADMPNI